MSLRRTSPIRTPILEVEDLSVDFRSEDGIVHAVRGVSFDLAEGEILGIVGESGSGKSVTNMALLGLLPKTATVKGSAKFKGAELVGLDDRELNKYRGSEIAMIFQDPMTSMNPVQKIGSQIAEAVRVHRDTSKKAAWARAVEMLELVGIPNPVERAKQYPHEFSGGMRQRAMIAMAMANEPRVIIADEPTTALDVTVQAQILEALRQVQTETGVGVILITHDLGVIANMAGRVMVMYAGKAVEQGTVDDIFDRPRMPYTLGLLGSLPRLEQAGERLTPIPGSPPSLVNLAPGCPFSSRCPLVIELCTEVEPSLFLVDDHHRAACHRMDELEGMDAETLFRPTAVDLTAVDMKSDELDAVVDHAEARLDQASGT